MAEKTHKPTPKKLRDARKQGDVVHSRELASVAAFLVIWGSLGWAVTYFARHLTNIAQRAITATDVQGQSWLAPVQSLLADMIWILGPLLGLGATAGVLVGFVQTRGAFSLTPITPKLQRLSPEQGLRNLFSIRSLIELGKMLTKTILLIGTLSYVLAASLDALAKAVYAPARDLLRISTSLTWRLMGYAVLIYIIGAGLDYAGQFYQFMKRQRMSIEEVRREHQDTEGNPRIKARRRNIGYEAVLAGALKPLSSATVIVTGPKRVSVAIYYVLGETPVPRVIAKGLDEPGARIRLQAERAGVPLFEDASLALRLFNEVPLDQFISEGLIGDVAAAIRWARQADRRTP